MFKKVLLNVFYNVAIIVMILCLFWGYKNGKYNVMAVSVFAVALFVFFKVRLIREIRQRNKK